MKNFFIFIEKKDGAVSCDFGRLGCWHLIYDYGQLNLKLIFFGELWFDGAALGHDDGGGVHVFGRSGNVGTI